MTNWGYDTPILGTAAINPSLLSTGRPDEFLDFVETLHQFPHRPIQLAYDTVIGHADFQGARLMQTLEADSPDPRHTKYLNSVFFRGNNMYGLDLSYQEPMVRALLLEMYQRKLNFGFDCVRVDGGQDFVEYVDSLTGFRVQDDDFLQAMVDCHLTIDGVTRYLDMNIEDGRPWPDDTNWLFNSTYMGHIMNRTQADGTKVKMWSGLIFAHNVHGKYKWFFQKYDRFKDLFKDGAHWVTGHSNHDNCRYFYKLVNPISSKHFKAGTDMDDYYNQNLGDERKQAVHRGLDNPALSTLMLGFMPGSPLFFLNALNHTPWLFYRNTDTRYTVKLLAEEGSRFFNWYVDDSLYQQPENFTRLKAMGFKELKQLADRSELQDKPAFLNRLFDLHEAIKVDPMLLLFIYDSPEGLGGFQYAQHLIDWVEGLKAPTSEEQTIRLARAEARFEADPLEADRKVKMAEEGLEKAREQVEWELAAAASDQEKSLALGKQARLKAIKPYQTDKKLFALFLESVADTTDYNPSEWAKDAELKSFCPSGFELSAESLIQMGEAFQADVAEICKIHRYAEQQDATLAEFNLKLRLYRQANPWLIQNPVNDFNKDFFMRNMIVNGGKHLGSFFSDKGDVMNANTLYYGWRTAPEQSKQVAFIGNMEGKPLAKLALRLYLPDPGPWKVIAKAPGMNPLPASLTDQTVLQDFKNGDALLLERSL